MYIRNYTYYSCDFETTIYEGQKETKVWLAGFVKLWSEECKIQRSIEEFWKEVTKLKGNLILYFHNLKFDGAFIIDYVIRELSKKGYKQALIEKEGNTRFLQEKEMLNNTYKYSISDMGQWYNIIIKNKGRIIEFRDSLKLLPFSLERLGKSFKTKHRKLTMEYEGERDENYEIKENEIQYFRNDLLCLKEGLEIMYNEGHNSLTIGSCCKEEYKNILKRSIKVPLSYEELFPQLTEINIPLKDKEGKMISVDKYIRKSYKGGWCYLVRGKEGKIKKLGVTYDVNSLYPSMMHSISGNYYPIGKGRYHKGKPTIEIEEKSKRNEIYYFIRIKTRFKLKKDKLPFIQIKGNYLYKGTECLETSDVYKNGKYNQYYINSYGDIEEAKPVLTLTQDDYELMREQYELYETEYIDYMEFNCMIGIFDEYIEKYMKIKERSEGAVRELAKLFLNNLYGKLATNEDSSFKIINIDEDGNIKLKSVESHEKKTWHIACGSVITSKSRCFTIRAAQKNYYGSENKGFIYADTDSIHVDLPPEEIKGIKKDNKKLCHWKLEMEWEEGIFIRQKTYIEENKDEFIIKCAGMGKRCKELLKASIKGEEIECKYEDEKEFIKEKRKKTDFKIGLKIPSKLMLKRIKGGVILERRYYELH